MTKNNEAIFEEAKIQFEARETGKAAKKFAKLVGSEPDNVEYRAWYAYVLFRQGEGEQAVEEAGKAIALDPHFLHAYRVRAIIHNAYGRYDKAQSDLDQMVMMDAENYETYLLRAEFFQQREDKLRLLEASIAAFEYSSLENGAAWENIQNIYSNLVENDGEYERALENFSERVDQEPLNHMPHMLRAGLYKAKDEHIAAIEDYSRAVELDPTFTKLALLERTACYNALERYEDALTDSARFYALMPKMPYEMHEDDKDWGSTVHNHFQTVLQPFFERDGEHLVEYWPCSFIFNHHKSEFPNRLLGTVTKYSGNYGTGYICLTDKKTIITTFEKFANLATHATDYGFGIAFMKLIVGKFISDLEPVGDHMWKVPNDTITKVHCSEVGVLDFESSVVNCRVTSTANVFQQIVTGLQMAKAGKFNGLWAVDPVIEDTETAQTLQLLEKLGELKSAGIVTEAEFEEKKAKLLAHI